MKKKTKLLALLLAAALILPTAGSTEAFAAGEYKQMDNTSTTFEGGFEFTSGLYTNAVTPVFSGGANDGKTMSEAGDVAMADNESAVVKLPQAFKYADGSIYDLYVKVTNTSGKEVTGTWTVVVDRDLRYVTLQPSSVPETSFDTEAWLENENGRVTNIDLVVGSCFVASVEGVRPWSDDGKLYSNIPASAFQWNADKRCWIPTGYDKADKYIISHGRTSDGTVKSGYVRTESGNCEMVFGYLAAKITFKNEDNAPAGALSETSQNPMDGANISAPSATPNAGYYLSGWTCSKAVKLSDGTTVEAGTVITPDQLSKVIATGELEFTAHYDAYTVEEVAEETDGSQSVVVKQKDSTVVTTVSIEAEDKVYDGKEYETEDNVSVSALDELKAIYPDATEGAKEYYIADENGNITDTKTNASNAGASLEGGAPVNVGTYYVKEIIQLNETETVELYTRVTITPKKDPVKDPTDPAPKKDDVKDPTTDKSTTDKNSSTADKNAKKTTAAKTADTAPAAAWSLVVVFAGAAAAATLVTRKKEQK